ncbi:ABC transporter permease [Candidatus Aerophobetes bacterium]|nr:ABC transporter permease [Candidatus Aerophobetes bacterium]
MKAKEEAIQAGREIAIGKGQKILHILNTGLKNYGIFFAFFITCVIMTILTPVFITPRNIFNIIRQVSMIGIIAIGMTFVILSAEIDLSVGSMVAFTGVIAAGLQVYNGCSTFIATLVPLLLATLLGIGMGVVITKTNVHSFVVTLGMLSIARGLGLIYSGGYPISGLNPSFRFIGGGMIGPVPVPVIIYLGVIIVGYFILSQTTFGKYVYAIGGNREAARLSGIPVNFYRTIVFGICSFSAGIAGIILASRVNSGQPTAGLGWELDVIASVIIGGTSLFGGRGGIIGTVIGSLFLGVLRNGLNLLGVSPFYQQVFIGLLIIIAVILDKFRR